MKIVKAPLYIQRPMAGEEVIQLFTANSFVKRNGDLVMGAGIAKYVRDRWPAVATDLGRKIDHLRFYGLRWSNAPGFHIGAFQVKYSWQDDADLNLIKRSAEKLAVVAKDRPHMTFRMNFPGIGNGRLPYEDVKPLLNCLPDNVEVYVIPQRQQP